ncbi:MAG TPA: catalase [Gammaproteobacteria bacterium]|nr:catalase [Gammaproteobacteria bacterium]
MATPRKTKNVTTETAERPVTARYGDQSVELGSGGETHQRAVDDHELTTQLGTPIADDQNSLRIGPRGPALLEDFHFREKLFHFDHERIPERAAYARGFGAHGFFETYESLADVTTADLFQRAGEMTPAFVRFSTLIGSSGSFDLARDVRGFAVKLYTQRGNWDLVGNSMPVFFIQDPIKFPDLVHAVKPAPDRGFPQAQSAHDNFWDFISLMPESMHMIMWLMSDRALPRSFRFMEGFGVHTFRLVNEAGRSTFVKFHWTPKLGLQSVVWNEAVKINGADPDFHRRDLWDAIEAGDFPEWELGMQLFDAETEALLPFDPLDPTKLITEELVPVRRVGRLVLDRNVKNFFAETEQVAFGTQNIVPGIEFSNDPLLQGRNFSYLDTQLKRLGGANFAQLPINAPQCPFRHFQQDGHMAMFNPSGRVNYAPNSWQAGRMAGESTNGGFESYRDEVAGTKSRARPESFADHYNQARQFYLSQTPLERQHIAAALVFELSKVETRAIRSRVVAHLLNVDDKLAMNVAEGLRLDALPPPATRIVPPRADLPESPGLSIMRKRPQTFTGRRLGVLVTDGVDGSFLQQLEAEFNEVGATVELIAPAIGGVKTEDGSWVEAHKTLATAPSVLFDAVALVVSPQASKEIASSLLACAFVSDAFAHCKFIAYTGDARPLLERALAGTPLDAGCKQVETTMAAAAFAARCAELRFWAREPLLGL